MSHSSRHDRNPTLQSEHFAYCAVFILVLVLLAVACVTPVNEDTPGTVTAATKSILTPSCENNSIYVDGSELLAPIAKRIAEEFMLQNPDVCIVIDSNGTQRGFERLCDGEVHINEAVLWPTDTDYRQCHQRGIEWLELPIMREGFGNFVSAQNNFVECLTLEQNRQIWQPIDGARVWSEVASHWPDKEIHRYAQLNVRGSPIFVDDPSYEDAERLERFDTGMVDNLSADPFGIGVFSAVYYARNKDRLKPVGVDEGKGCIAPDPLVVEPGQLPVWGHVIKIYVDQQTLHEYQLLQEFLEFFMVKVSIYAREEGFFPLSSEEYEENRVLIRTNSAVP